MGDGGPGSGQGWVYPSLWPGYSERQGEMKLGEGEVGPAPGVRVTRPSAAGGCASGTLISPPWGSLLG